jgi:hypothetical protein
MLGAWVLPDFRNLFMYSLSTTGKKDGIPIIPLSEMRQKMSF